jgi:hypothetical protein
MTIRLAPHLYLAEQRRIVAKVDELVAVLDDLEAALEQFHEIENDLKE